MTDEGPGVPTAEREAVWVPFQRGKSPGPIAGSGIGLAIVRDVATRHGGRSWIEDGPPTNGAPKGAPNGTNGNGVHGASFVVSLPIA